MSFRIKFASIFDGQFLTIFLCLLFNTFPPFLTPLCYIADLLTGLISDLFLVLQLQRTIPLIFVKVQKHLLFELVTAVIYVDGVIVLVETLVHGLDRRLVQVAVH